MCFSKVAKQIDANSHQCFNCKSHEKTMPKVAYYRSISGNGNTYVSDSVEDITFTQESITSNRMDIGSAVKVSLLDAQDQGRLTSGVYEAAQLLEMNPDGVMLCILPEDAALDVGLHIHFTLIEAFCWENDISVIKVDSSEKLHQILSKSSTSSLLNDNDEAGGRLLSVDDCSCLLIEYPAGDISESDEDILIHHKKTAAVVPESVITLPD